MLENIKKIIPEMEKSDSQSFYSNAIKYKAKTSPKKIIISFATFVILLAIIIPVCINMLDLQEEDIILENVPSVNDDGNDSSVPGSVDPGKDKSIATRYFDIFYAFGSASPVSMYSTDILLNSNILSEENKNILRQSENSSNSWYNVYLGMKDGVDCVVLTQLEEPYSILVFESNLDYSFTDCIIELEEMCGEELTQEFLISSKFDNQLKKETKGILVYFELIDGVYYAYYTLEFNGTTYVLKK